MRASRPQMFLWRAGSHISLYSGLLLEQETCLRGPPFFSFPAHSVHLPVN